MNLITIRLQFIENITIKVKIPKRWNRSFFPGHPLLMSIIAYLIGLPTQSNRATPESSVTMLQFESFPVP